MSVPFFTATLSPDATPLKAALDALPGTTELCPLKFADAAVLARVALDYELLVEQFHDFMREDEHRAEQPLAEAA